MSFKLDSFWTLKPYKNSRPDTIVSKYIVESVNKTAPKLAGVIANLRTHQGVRDLFTKISEIKYCYYQVLFMRNDMNKVFKPDFALDTEIKKITDDFACQITDGLFGSVEKFLSSVDAVHKYLKMLLFNEIKNKTDMLETSVFDNDVKEFSQHQSEFEDSVKFYIDNPDKFENQEILKEILQLIDKDSDENYHNDCLALYIFSLFDSYCIDFDEFCKNSISETCNPMCVSLFMDYLTLTEDYGKFVNTSENTIFKRNSSPIYTIHLYDFVNSGIFAPDKTTVNELVKMMDCGEVYVINYSVNAENNDISTDVEELYTF